MTPRVPVMGDEVRTEENFFRWTITINSSQVAVEHPAQCDSIHNATVNGKADNPSGKLIHHR